MDAATDLLASEFGEPAFNLIDPRRRCWREVNRPGFAGGSNSWEIGAMETKKTAKSFSLEVRDRAVRMVREHRRDYGSEWEAILSIASKIGCTGESLRRWLRQAERDTGERAGLTSDERARLKALERENRELRQANEILRKASAYFAQAELDRRFKP
jgi:transposase-like protein